MREVNGGSRQNPVISGYLVMEEEKEIEQTPLIINCVTLVTPFFTKHKEDTLSIDVAKKFNCLFSFNKRQF